MIRINLLPKEAQRAVSSLESLRWKMLTQACVGAVVGVSLFLFVLNQWNGRALAQLSSEWDRLQPERSKLVQAQDALRALENRTQVLNALKAPQAQWAPRLNLLSDAIVKQLWFTSLEFGPSGSGPSPAQKPAQAPASPKAAATAKPKPAPPPPPPPMLVLKGSALVTDAGSGAPVNRYMQKLKDRPEFRRWFKGAELKTVEQRQVHQDQVSDFEIVLSPEGV